MDKPMEERRKYDIEILTTLAVHTEKLVSIQTAISGVEAKLAIQNGRVAKSEEKYNSLPCKTRDEVSKNNALWLKIHLVGLWSCICGIIYVVYEVIKNK